MKTIAITIDEPTLEAIDKLAREQSSRNGNRSRVVRAAIRQYVLSETRRKQEEAETRILKIHRERLARQAKALVAEQARV